MKLQVIILAFLLSGCGLVKTVAMIPATAVLIPTSVADRVLGTHMANSISSQFDEAFKDGKKVDAEAIKRDVSGHTVFGTKYTYFLKKDGTTYYKDKEGNKVEQGQWTATLGELCLDKRCYEIRTKNNQMNYGSIKLGDTENLSTKWENQVQAEIDKKRTEAEALERKQLTDPMYEKAGKLAVALNCEQALELDRAAQSQDGKIHSDNDRSNGYHISFSGCKSAAAEAKCIATPKCRAQKEQAALQYRAEIQRKNEQSCDHLYTGKAVRIRYRECTAFSLYCFDRDVEGMITGVLKTNGLATARETNSGKLHELGCSEF